MDDTPTAQTARLGYVIYLRRVRLRLSQAEAASRADMHRNYLGSIERGEVNPTYETLRRVARGLGVPLHEIVQEADTTTEARPSRRRRVSKSRSE